MEILGIDFGGSDERIATPEDFKPTLMAKLVELQEENARLREDAERLEWLFNEECLVTTFGLRGGGFRYSVDWPGLNESQRETFATPREAIDAARKEQK